MKKQYLYILSAITIISISFNLFAFKNLNPKQIDEHILVEIYEVPRYPDSGVHIHYGNGKTEVIPFKEFQKDNHDDNGEIIINAINKLERDGYDLTHVASGLATNGMITKIFMVKRK